MLTRRCLTELGKRRTWQDLSRQSCRVVEDGAGEQRNFAGPEPSIVSRWLVSTANRVRVVLTSESVS